MLFKGQVMAPATIMSWPAFLVVCTLLRQGMPVQNIFNEMENSNAKTSSLGNVSIFNEAFHQCSMDEHCNFVVLDLQANEYRKYAAENDLPVDVQSMRIWKKHFQGIHRCQIPVLRKLLLGIRIAINFIEIHTFQEIRLLALLL